MTTAAENDVNMATNITSDKGVKLLVQLSKAEAGATTMRIAHTNHVINILYRENFSITMNKQKQCKKEFYICLN